MYSQEYSRSCSAFIASAGVPALVPNCSSVKGTDIVIVYIYMYVHVHTYIHTYIHMCIHMYVCLYVYVYIYIYMYIFSVPNCSSVKGDIVIELRMHIILMFMNIY
jgi:hypothetical protein